MRRELEKLATSLAEIHSLLNLTELCIRVLSNKVCAVSRPCYDTVRNLHDAFLRVRAELLGQLFLIERITYSVLGYNTVSRIEADTYEKVLTKLLSADGIRHHPVLQHAVAIADAVHDIASSGKVSEGVDTDWWVILHRLITDRDFFKKVAELARGCTE